MRNREQKAQISDAVRGCITPDGLSHPSIPVAGFVTDIRGAHAAVAIAGFSELAWIPLADLHVVSRQAMLRPFTSRASHV